MSNLLIILVIRVW